MKRTISLTLLLFTGTLAAFAGPEGRIGAAEIMFLGNAIAILTSIGIAAYFLLTVIRLFLSHRLRGALIEKNASGEVIAQILPPKNDMGLVAIKWCCLFVAAGLGFTICYFNQPIGLHWAIIMSFSLAAGLLAFYFISKRIK